MSKLPVRRGLVIRVDYTAAYLNVRCETEDGDVFTITGPAAVNGATVPKIGMLLIGDDQRWYSGSNDATLYQRDGDLTHTGDPRTVYDQYRSIVHQRLSTEDDSKRVELSDIGELFWKKLTKQEQVNAAEWEVSYVNQKLKAANPSPLDLWLRAEVAHRKAVQIEEDLSDTLSKTWEALSEDDRVEARRISSDLNQVLKQYKEQQSNG